VLSTQTLNRLSLSMILSPAKLDNRSDMHDALPAAEPGVALTAAPMTRHLAATAA
jgi:hypothetical protein